MKIIKLHASVGMSITPYLSDFDASPETKRLLGVALEMTRVSLGLGDNFADGIIAKRIVPRPASAIPISCLKARSRNYAGICTQTNKQRWVSFEIECEHGSGR